MHREALIVGIKRRDRYRLTVAPFGAVENEAEIASKRALYRLFLTEYERPESFHPLTVHIAGNPAVVRRVPMDDDSLQLPATLLGSEYGLGN